MFTCVNNVFTLLFDQTDIDKGNGNSDSRGDVQDEFGKIVTSIKQNLFFIYYLKAVISFGVGLGITNKFRN